MGQISSQHAEQVVILPFPKAKHLIAAATHYRSTWLLSSIRALRDRGSIDAYLRHVGPRRDQLLALVAGVWVPVAWAADHYRACEALKLPIADQLAMGKAVGEMAQGSLIDTATKLVRGTDPWAIAPLFERLYHRAVDGGGTGVFQTGPKEARIEFTGVELFAIPYFRNAFRGVVLGVVSLVSSTVTAHDITPSYLPHESWMRLEWT